MPTYGQELQMNVRFLHTHRLLIRACDMYSYTLVPVYWYVCTKNVRGQLFVPGTKTILPDRKRPIFDLGFFVFDLA